MPHPHVYYTNLRNQFTPEDRKLIFLLESPPSNGNFFYDKRGVVTEPLFSAIMKFFNIQADTKEEGLREFCNRGYLLVDATYTPVDEIDDNAERNRLILDNYENLKKDLKSLGALDNQMPIILVKTNICDLLMERLKSNGFNVINDNIRIPYPSTGQQKKFQVKLSEVFVCREIKTKSELKDMYLSYGIPDAYTRNRKDVQAFVLGADPSNFSNNGQTVKLKKVFGITGKDQRYFKKILNNLSQVGLSMKNIFVQNVVRNYMTVETSQNHLWLKFAELWKPLLLEELDAIDPQRKLPVFATAEIIIKALLNNKTKPLKPARRYFEDKIIHFPEENYLGRKLIPCFRYNRYQDYPNFVDFVKEIMK